MGSWMQFRKRHGVIAVLGAFLVGVVVLNALLGTSDTDTTLTEMLIRMVVVIGLSAFVSNSGIVSFGHVGFMCIGAYAAAWIDADPSFKQIMLSGLPPAFATSQAGFLPAMLAATVLPAVVALLLGGAIMRLSGIAASIATFAFLIMVNSVYSNWDSVTAGVSSIIGIPTVVGPWTALAVALVALAASQAFATSRIGLMLRASRDDDVAAKAAGVNVVAMRLAAFAFSAALVGSGGGLYAHFLGILTIDVFYLNLSFITLAMLVVGGLGDLGGAVVGVLAVTVITQGLRLFERGVGLGSVQLQVPHGSQEIGLGILMALILVLSPRGLLRMVLQLSARRRSGRTAVPALPGH